MLIRARVHPFPSRTRKLSSLLLTILGWRRPGKIGSANTKPCDESRGVLSCQEKCSSGCLRHHPVTGQLSSLLLTILGWRRPGKIGSANTKPRDESRGVCVSITPRPCHSEPVTDVTGVGIRNLLAGNLRKSAGIMRFGNGLPRQSVPQGHLLRGADWLAMTGFFDRLTTRRKSRGFVVSGRVQFGMPTVPSRDRSMGGMMPVAYERAGGRTA